jgi:hypothetical protein
VLIVEQELRTLQEYLGSTFVIVMLVLRNLYFSA